MSPSCLQDSRDCGCDPRLRPSKLSLIPPASPGTGGIPCQAEPRAKPQPRAGAAQSLHWKIKCCPQQEGKKRDGSTRISDLSGQIPDDSCEETQIPADEELEMMLSPRMPGTARMCCTPCCSPKKLLLLSPTASTLELRGRCSLVVQTDPHLPAGNSLVCTKLRGDGGTPPHPRYPLHQLGSSLYTLSNVFPLSPSAIQLLGVPTPLADGRIAAE